MCDVYLGKDGTRTDYGKTRSGRSLCDALGMVCHTGFQGWFDVLIRPPNFSNVNPNEYLRSVLPEEFTSHLYSIRQVFFLYG